jgi:hypothetical protein
MRTRADLKGITNAAVPLYGSTRCHLMVQGTWFCDLKHILAGNKAYLGRRGVGCEQLLGSEALR